MDMGFRNIDYEIVGWDSVNAAWKKSQTGTVRSFAALIAEIGTIQHRLLRQQRNLRPPIRKLMATTHAIYDAAGEPQRTHLARAV